MADQSCEAFKELVWQKSRELYRDMPWRDEPNFYNVLVSELMLQQTQVSRVLVKFAEFMHTFPTVEDLAHASLADVLRVWQGLGYNRRAKFLHEAAKQVIEHGQPTTIEELVKLPGVGRNTAGALMNYVYEEPTPFIETNIRTVFIHHFFMGEKSVSDREIHELVEATLDYEHPRQWFWALMDYGSWLKSQGVGVTNVSKHYRKQTPLKGSVREVRGQIIARLSTKDYEIDEIAGEFNSDERFTPAIEGLLKDGLITRSGDMVHLTKH
ncbi:MAG: A/G-specific adenine glycosylase [Candidatus Saccharimonas sp.]